MSFILTLKSSRSFFETLWSIPLKAGFKSHVSKTCELDSLATAQCATYLLNGVKVRLACYYLQDLDFKKPDPQLDTE